MLNAAARWLLEFAVNGTRKNAGVKRAAYVLSKSEAN